jgi:hypothetical protein
MVEPRLAKAASRLALPAKEAVELSRVGDAVDAHVDDRRAGLDHLRRDEAGAADGGHQNVGLAGDRAQVARLRVADGDGGVLVEQQHGRRLAHNVAAAHHHGVLAGDGNPLRLRISIIPAGVQGASAGRPACKRPALTG